MTHIQLQNKFKKKLVQHLEQRLYLYYKIPDCKGVGGLRPFDSFLVYHGKFFAIEFKVGRDKLKKHQEYFLNLATLSGGKSLVITDKDNIDDIIKEVLNC